MPSRRLGSLLFTLVMLFFLVTTTPFADLNGASQADPQAGGSNWINQAVALGLTAGLAVWGSRHPLARDALLQPRVLLTTIFVWFGVVSAVSSTADDSLRRLILAAMTCFDASVFLLLPRSTRHFSRLLLLGVGIMLAVAYFGVVALPGRAIHQATELIEPEHAGLWHGQFPHKNAAAATMVLACLIGLFTYDAGHRFVSLVVIGFSVLFLIHTGGKSAIAYLPATIAVAWVFERVPWSRIPIVVGGPVLFNVVAIACALSDGMREFVRSYGIDPTFTARTDIWRLALDAIQRSPILGYGFQGYWQTHDLFYSGGVGVGWAVQAFNGHNSWIDLVLTTGLPSLFPVFAWLVVLPLRHIAQAEGSGNDPALTRLFMRIWLYALFQSCLESLFFQSGNFEWFALLFAIFGLRLQARACECRDAAGYPPVSAADDLNRPGFPGGS